MRLIDADAVREEMARAGLTTRFIDAAPTVDPWEGIRRDAQLDPPPELESVLVRLGGSRFGAAYAVGYRTGGTYWLNDEEFSCFAREVGGWWSLHGEGE